MEELPLTVLYPLGLLLMALVALMSQITLQFARWLILWHSKWRGGGGQNGLQDSEERFGQIPRVKMYSRRTLLHTAFPGQPSGPSQPVAGTTATGSSFDANVVMILAVLLCALICALGINSIARCALRCSSRVVVDAEQNHVTRLAKGGLRRKALRAMPILVYSTGLKLNTACPMCTICLSDFEAGEHVKVLPKCNHGFHVICIDRWLLARSSCPTCRQSLFGEPQKTSGCSEVSQADPAGVHAVLVPLRPEGLITTYDF